MRHVYFSGIIVMLFALTQGSIAQSYIFSLQQDTYENLDNPTSLTGGEYWDDFSFFNIPLDDFTFSFYGNSYDTLWIGSGSVSFTISLAGGFTDFSGQEIAPFGTYGALRERNNEPPHVSPINYSITGQAGGRILKLEWRNAGLVDDETENDFMNIQLWLYEASGVVELRYGPSSVTNPDVFIPGANGPLVGMYDDNPANGYYLSGDPANPTVGPFPPFPALNGVPPEGTVYRFTPATSSVASLQSAGYQVYPNPCNDWLRVEHTQQIKAGTLRITDISGRTVLSQQYDTDQQIQLSTNQLHPGMYILELRTDQERLQSKVIKR